MIIRLPLEIDIEELCPDNKIDELKNEIYYELLREIKQEIARLSIKEGAPIISEKPDEQIAAWFASKLYGDLRQTCIEAMKKTKERRKK